MTAYQMKNEITAKFGADSFENHYAQHLFADRGEDWLERYYKQVMGR